MKKLAVLLVAGLVMAGCNTTNALIRVKPDYTDLPTAALQTLASDIETVVSEGEEAFELEAPDGLTVETPAIRQAIRTRAIRATLIDELLSSGFAVEENNGLISILRSSAYKKATTSQQRDREAMIVMSENQNRWTIYEGLLEANNWPPRSLSAVQEIFFQARVPLLEPGQAHDEVQAQ